MTLRVEHRDGETYNFSSADSDTSVFVVRDAVEVSPPHGHRFIAHGKLDSGSGHATAVLIRYVLKNDYIPLLKNELEAYLALADLQGVKIPLCYGLFENTSAPTCQYRAALVLQDLQAYGEHICRPLRELSLTFRRELAQIFISIHRHGVWIGQPVAVFDVDGSPMICGFSSASKHESECDAVNHPSLVGSECLEPDIVDFGCDDLFYLCSRAEIWIPRYFNFFGKRCDTNKLYAQWPAVADSALGQATLEEILNALEDAQTFIARTYTPSRLPKVEKRLEKLKAQHFGIYKATRLQAMASARPREYRSSPRYLSWPRSIHPQHDAHVTDAGTTSIKASQIPERSDSDISEFSYGDEGDNKSMIITTSPYVEEQVADGNQDGSRKQSKKRSKWSPVARFGA
ncbi:hypothetical protein EXIGLDRAFT_716754 [Exidia glandulosa HHB12029]|uniref:Uncharacterized protein n=1 Tax=Exidia glandulosa HHB12029 TaxID=1314781 RepID=A0A165IRI2_EXIGL|nr:hypothetical protein EXIGLDRAFT_716754 [Exidia glandulosa HHB12029]